MKRKIIFLAIPLLLLFTNCEKYDKLTYYKVKGVGYVYYKDTKEPAAYMQIGVSSTFRSNGIFTVTTDTEFFSADSTGYYSVKFLKRTKRENVRVYNIYPSTNYYHIQNHFYTYWAEDLQNAKGNIQLDTMWLIPNH
jgi:hypothetical protein